ncbi:SRPBCC family protein [Kordiimonas pumila]|uniref:SRPBCC family protein n=1 Tax=Kordiimonas pumila TaxID=2161677 RepID=A0ABV7D693_9PROT|nr:SRPBCC family protein [Kordiimonas pumila]
MAHRPKDRFRDWNLYHKSVVGLLCSIAVAMVVHAALVYDGAFHIKHEKLISVEAATLWPWIISDDNRDRWTTELIDTGVLSGDAGQKGTTRLLFWKRGTKRWHSLEKVTESLPGRVFASYQESDMDKRWLRIDLVPAGPCQTRVEIEETIFPVTYKDRFWFFLSKDDQDKRVIGSLDALDRWTVKSECNLTEQKTAP